MDKNKKFDDDIIDEDLYEEFEQDELIELVQEARQEALEKARRRREEQKSKQPFPKWLFCGLLRLHSSSIFSGCCRKRFPSLRSNFEDVRELSQK